MLELNLSLAKCCSWPISASVGAKSCRWSSWPFLWEGSASGIVSVSLAYYWTFLLVSTSLPCGLTLSCLFSYFSCVQAERMSVSCVNVEGASMSNIRILRKEFLMHRHRWWWCVVVEECLLRVFKYSVGILRGSEVFLTW